MKKLFFILCALLATAWAAKAETYTITYGTSTGTFYNSSNAAVTSGWVSKWVSNEADKPVVTLTVSANNVNAENGRFAPGSSTTSTYSLSVEDGYKITGFSLNCPTFGAEVTVTPNGESAVVAATGENIVVTSSASSFVYSGSNSGRIQAGANDGGSFTISVESIPAEKVAAYNTAKGWISTIQSSNGLVKDASKYISNAKSTAEGSYEALLDGDYTTYFHTAYGNAGPAEDHYLQAELTEAVDAIHFYYKKRSQNNNNRPTSITLAGSNDGTTFTDITTINSGLPTTATELEYTSDKISLGAAYKYLRFTVTATNNSAVSNGHVFFTFSEFYITPSDNNIDEAISIYKTLPSNPDLLTDAQVAQINQVNTDLTSTIVNVTYELYESDGTTLLNTVVVEQNKNSEVSVPASFTSSPYYDYVSEGTIGTENCTIKVTRTLKSTVVHPITNLSNNKAYTLTTERGALGTNGTQMVSTFGTSFTAGNFAIISYENNYYLYSIADSKFVGNPVTINQVANQPQLTEDLSLVTPVSFALTSPPYYFIGMGSNGVNVSSYATGIVVNNWTTHDPGNQYVIQEVAEFDPTAALAALEEYFHPSYTVTYKVQDEGGNILFTSEPVGTTLGASITTLPEEYQLTDFYNYNTIDITVSGTETEAVFTATLKEAPIFKFTADATSPVWHKLKIKDANYPTYVADGTPNVTLPTTDANNETVHWAFIGEPYAGFQIINRAAGTGLILGSASATNDGNNGGNTYVTLASPGSQTYEVFHAYHSGQLTNGFFLFNAEGYAMNQRSTDNLAYWTGGYDKGSTFVAEEVSEGEELFNTLIAQLEAIPFGTGLNQYKLFVEGTDYTTQAATIISGLKNAGYSAENLANAQLMLDGTIINLPAAGFYRIKGNTSGKYLAAGLASNNKFNMSDATDATTIFYFDGSKLTNFGSGKCNGMSKTAWAWVVGESASTVTFSDGETNGGYAIQSSNAFFYDGGTSADRGSSLDTNVRYRSWYLEEVAELPVAISDAKYATLYTPAALTIPSGVTAYYISALTSTEATLTAISTTIPANTGVVLYAETPNTYNFAITEGGTAVDGNKLVGQVAAQTVEDGVAYTLQKSAEDASVVGLFPKKAGEIAGFKAYMLASVLPTAGGEVKGISFRLDDTETGLNAISSAKDNDVIYDLSGRRVGAPTRGLYIVGGKKVMVK